MLVLYALIRTVETRNWKAAVGLGAALGFAYLSRSMLFLWTPVTCVAVYFLARPRQAPWLAGASLRTPLYFVAGFMVVASPWMVRNCLVLERFEPLGTMGGINLPTAYSDTALKRRGQWFRLRTSGLARSLWSPSGPMQVSLLVFAIAGFAVYLFKVSGADSG